MVLVTNQQQANRQEQHAIFYTLLSAVLPYRHGEQMRALFFYSGGTNGRVSISENLEYVCQPSKRSSVSDWTVIPFQLLLSSHLLH
jgi:hypothetical protein